MHCPSNVIYMEDQIRDGALAKMAILATLTRSLSNKFARPGVHALVVRTGIEAPRSSLHDRAHSPPRDVAVSSLNTSHQARPATSRGGVRGGTVLRTSRNRRDGATVPSLQDTAPRFKHVSHEIGSQGLARYPCTSRLRFAGQTRREDENEVIHQVPSSTRFQSSSRVIAMLGSASTSAARLRASSLCQSRTMRGSSDCPIPSQICSTLS